MSNRRGYKYNTVPVINPKQAKKLTDMSKAMIDKTNEDIERGARQECYITIGKRRVSILPFFANAASFIDDSEAFGALSSLYAKDEKELVGMASKDYKWYRDIIGRADFSILEGLCGHPHRYITRYLVIGAMQNFDAFYKVMITAIFKEAIGASKTGSQKNEYTEGTQNTMALSYYICIKWFRDKKFVTSEKLDLGFVDELIEDILSIPGPVQDFFNNEIDEYEFKDKQFELSDKPYGEWNLSHIHRETLESYGINTASDDILRNKRDSIMLANDLCNFKTSQEFKVFKEGIGGALVNNNMILKALNERDFLKKELDDILALKAESQKELRYTKKQLRKAKDENGVLSCKVAKLTECIQKLPEETNKCIKELNNNLTSKDEEISLLYEQMEELKNELNSIKKEDSSLKKQVKKLSAKLEDTLEKNAVMQDELESIGNCDIDESVPLEVIVDKIKDKRIVMIGGTDNIGKTLSDMGLNIKQHDASTNIGAKDMGNYDCIVFMIKYIPHTSVWWAKSEAKKADKPIVYHYGTNIENICREVYTKLNC